MVNDAACLPLTFGENLPACATMGEKSNCKCLGIYRFQ